MSHTNHKNLSIPSFTFLLVTLVSLAGYSQARFSYSGGYGDPDMLYEAGIALGIMNGVTDIQGTKNNGIQGPFAGTTFRKSRFSAGAYFSGVWRNRIGARMEFNVGSMEGYDSLLKGATSKTAIGRYDRNLNFRSPITELALTAELHPIMIFSNFDREKPAISPYFITGIAWFKFNPQAYTADGWVDLAPLRLEGQGFDEYPDRQVYNTYSWSYPAGIGVRWDATPKLTIRLEVNKRTTFTDYIDDVHEANWVDPSLFYKYLPVDKANLAAQLYNRSPSINPPRNTRPRGHPDENDAYWTTVLKFGFNINGNNYSSGMGARDRKGIMKKMRCTLF